MRILATISIALCAAAPLVYAQTSCPVPAPAYYVSAGAPPGGTGSAAAPFNSLAQAQRAMQASAVKAAIVSGSFTLTADWQLSAADSDETWTASPQGATISGGICSVSMPSGPKTYAVTSGCHHIILDHANNVTIQGLSFQNLASALLPGWSAGGGIILDHASGNRITANTFNNCTMSCITGIYSANNSIDNNVINGVSDGYPPGFNIDSTAASDGLQYVPAAISVGSWDPSASAHNAITNNLIQNAQGGGINWYGSNVTITGNIIRDSGTELYDGGAIYSYDPYSHETGDQVTNNAIINFATNPGSDFVRAVGIYLDNGVSNVLVDANTLIGAGGRSIWVHGGHGEQITNNVIGLLAGERGISSAPCRTCGVPSYTDVNNSMQSAALVSPIIATSRGPQPGACSPPAPVPVPLPTVAAYPPPATVYPPPLAVYPPPLATYPPPLVQMNPPS